MVFKKFVCTYYREYFYLLHQGFSMFASAANSCVLKICIQTVTGDRKFDIYQTQRCKPPCKPSLKPIGSTCIITKLIRGVFYFAGVVVLDINIAQKYSPDVDLKSLCMNKLSWDDEV